MIRTIPVLAFALVVAVLAPLGAYAQSAPGAPGSDQVIPEKQAPGPVAPPKTNGRDNLSNKLNRTNGVITPPADVDPKINRPAPVPNPNSTPVIPPPGTPGGQGNVQPK